MRVGIMLEMAKAFVVLRNRVFQKQQKIVFHIRVGILVDRQTARRMLREQHAHAVGRSVRRKMLINLAGYLDHFFAEVRPDVQSDNFAHASNITNRPGDGLSGRITFYPNFPVKLAE